MEMNTHYCISCLSSIWVIPASKIDLFPIAINFDDSEQIQLKASKNPTSLCPVKQQNYTNSAPLQQTGPSFLSLEML